MADDRLAAYDSATKQLQLALRQRLADNILDPGTPEGAAVATAGGGGGGSTPDATTTVKGKIQLAGDLAGTAAAPTVPGLASKAPLASPAFTGTPTVPTASAGTNTTQAASTAFVQAAVAALIAAAPGALDTLDELAAAMGDDANFATTVTNALALKAALASPTFTGDPKAPTPSPGDNDTSIATTAFVTAAIAAAGGGGGGSSVPTPRMIGYYYPPSIPIEGRDDGGTLTAGTAELLPFIVGGNSITVDSIGIAVGTADPAGTVIRLGIYGSTAAGQPGSLVVDAGTVSGASTGDKTLAISQVLTPGLYWLLMVPSAASTLRVRKSAGSAVAWSAWTKGSSGLDTGDTGATLRTTGWTAGSALPGTAILTGMTFRRIDVPLVFVRRSA